MKPKTGSDFSNEAYDALRANPLTTRETITQKFYFVQGFKAGVDALAKATEEERRELLKFVENGFFFAKQEEPK